MNVKFNYKYDNKEKKKSSVFELKWKEKKQIIICVAIRIGVSLKNNIDI